MFGQGPGWEKPSVQFRGARIIHFWATPSVFSMSPWSQHFYMLFFSTSASLPQQVFWRMGSAWFWPGGPHVPQTPSGVWHPIGSRQGSFLFRGGPCVTPYALFCGSLFVCSRFFFRTWCVVLSVSTSPQKKKKDNCVVYESMWECMGKNVASQVG